jgi:hypothetical protein
MNPFGRLKSQYIACAEGVNQALAFLLGRFELVANLIEYPGYLVEFAILQVKERKSDFALREFKSRRHHHWRRARRQHGRHHVGAPGLASAAVRARALSARSRR